MRAAIYCRLSEEDREKQAGIESGSIQNQKSMLLQYAGEQGWEIFRIYSDEDYTGADRRRPEFNRLLQDAAQHKFDIVLCKTQSRFTRELELVEKYIHGLFPLWGIRFVSVVDNADTANKGNKKSRQINGLVNEWYLEDLSENIRSVLVNRRENGLHIGSFALYGYRKDPEQKGHLLIDEEAAAVVREVFHLFAQGYGKTAIARMLNERGIPNPTEYKRLHGLRYRQPQMKNSTRWRYSAIASMLTNEIYIGNMVQGKYGSISYKTKQNKPRPKESWYRVEGTHEPVIDRALWEQVQARIAQQTKPFAAGTVGLFAGKARCAACGYALRSTQNGGRRYLQCPSRHAEKNSCPGAFISVEKLENMVTAELNRLLAEFLDREEWGRELGDCSGMQEQRRRLLSSLKDCRKKAEEYSRALPMLYLDKVNGLLSEKDFAGLAKGLSAGRDYFEYAVREGERALGHLDEEMMGNQPSKLLEHYAQVEHLTREMVETLIDYISVGKRIPGTRDVPIEIHWKF